MTKLSQSPRRGFTLMEMAIALGIIGMILAAIWAAASNVAQSQQANQAVQDILAITQGTRALYATSPNTQLADGTSLTSILISAGVIPGSMASNGANSVSTPWGPTSSLTIYSASTGTAGAGNAFLIELSNLPTAKALGACNALLLGVGGGGAAQSYGLYYAGSKAATQAGVLLPNTITTTSCAAASAFIDFVFTLN